MKLKELHKNENDWPVLNSSAFYEILQESFKKYLFDGKDADLP